MVYDARMPPLPGGLLGASSMTFERVFTLALTAVTISASAVVLFCLIALAYWK